MHYLVLLIRTHVATVLTCFYGSSFYNSNNNILSRPCIKWFHIRHIMCFQCETIICLRFENYLEVYIWSVFIELPSPFILNYFTEKVDKDRKMSRATVCDFKSFLGVSGRLRSTSIMDAIHRFQCRGLR